VEENGGKEIKKKSVKAKREKILTTGKKRGEHNLSFKKGGVGKVFLKGPKRPSYLT